MNTVIMFTSAMMENKSSMGVIVAAPTAGSCGALPGAVLGVASAMNLPEEEAVKGMLAAGMIGLFIAAHATFAAEVGGCQAECGSGSGMAAASAVFQECSCQVSRSVVSKAARPSPCSHKAAWARTPSVGRLGMALAAAWQMARGITTPPKPV